MDLICKYCSRVSLSRNSDTNHQRLCKLNPTRQATWLETISVERRKELTDYKIKTGKTGNQYTKAEKEGRAKPEVSKEWRDNHSRNMVLRNVEFWSKQENRDKQSLKMQKVARDNPEVYSHKNMGRSKTIFEDGIRFDSSWELAFYNWCKETNIKCDRNTDGFPYEYKGDKTYFPDFYLPEYDLYVEIKGYETDRDRAKWKYFPKSLKVIKDITNLSIKLLE